MNRRSWIVCERSQRWAAALRLLLDQESRRDGTPHRLMEVRTLGGSLRGACRSIRIRWLASRWTARISVKF